MNKLLATDYSIGHTSTGAKQCGVGMSSLTRKLEENWSWVVLVASFCNQFISLGIPFSFGIYNVEFLDEFGDSKANTAWVSSIHIAFVLGAGPIVAYVVDRTSNRTIACLGAAISALGAILTVFATELFHLYITVGVIMGAGFCMVYMPSAVLVGLHFTRNRTFATGMASCGATIGCVILPLLYTHIIEAYSWKGSMFIIAGLCIQMMVFSLLLRPVKPSENLEMEFGVREKGKPIVIEVINEGDDFKGSHATESLEMKESNKSDEDSKADDVSEKEVLLKDRHTKILDTENDAEFDSNKLESSNTEYSIGAKRAINSSNDRVGLILCKSEISESENVLLEPNREVRSAIDIERSPHCASKFSRNREMKDMLGKTETQVDRPIVSDLEEGGRKDDGGYNFCWSLWQTRLSKHILCDFKFLIYFINNVFWNLGTGVVIIISGDYVYELGAGKSNVSIVVMVIGIGGVLGGLIGAIVGNWKRCNRVLGYCLVCAVCGIVSVLYIATTNVIIINVLGGLFGLTMGLIVSWLVAVTADIMGIGRLGEAYGYLMLANGIGNLAGPPLGGWLFDLTGDYTATFCMAGALTFSSGVLMILVPLETFIRGH